MEVSGNPLHATTLIERCIICHDGHRTYPLMNLSCSHKVHKFCFENAVHKNPQTNQFELVCPIDQSLLDPNKEISIYKNKFQKLTDKLWDWPSRFQNLILIIALIGLRLSHLPTQYWNKALSIFYEEALELALYTCLLYQFEKMHIYHIYLIEFFKQLMNIYKYKTIPLLRIAVELFLLIPFSRFLVKIIKEFKNNQVVATFYKEQSSDSIDHLFNFINTQRFPGIRFLEPENNYTKKKLRVIVFEGDDASSRKDIFQSGVLKTHLYTCTPPLYTCSTSPLSLKLDREGKEKLPLPQVITLMKNYKKRMKKLDVEKCRIQNLKAKKLRTYSVNFTPTLSPPNRHLLDLVPSKVELESKTAEKPTSKKRRSNSEKKPSRDTFLRSIKFEESCSIYPLEVNINRAKLACLRLMERDPERDTVNSEPRKRESQSPPQQKKEAEPDYREGKYLLKKSKKEEETPLTKKNSKNKKSHFLSLTEALTSEDKGLLKDRLMGAIHALDSLESMIMEIIKEKLKFEESSVLNDIYRKALEYHFLKFSEAIHPTGLLQDLKRDQPIFDYFDMHFFSVNKLHELRNAIRSSFLLIKWVELFDLIKKFHDHHTLIHMKHMMGVGKGRGRPIPLDLSDVSLCSKNFSKLLEAKEHELRDDFLMRKIKKELKFIPSCIKPFKDSQAQFLLASGMYLDALKKTLSNIAKLSSFLSSEKKMSLLGSCPEFPLIIQWGNSVAHDFGEELEIEIAVDELPLGKIWDLFSENSFVDALSKKFKCQ